MIGTVIVNTGPSHPVASLAGVISYTTLSVPVVRFSYDAVIASVPVAVPVFRVRLASALAVQENADGILLPPVASTFACGSKLKTSSEHTAVSVEFTPSGSRGVTVMVAVQSSLLPSSSVTVIVTV